MWYQEGNLFFMWSGMFSAENETLYVLPVRTILFKSGGSMELALRVGDHFWRYVFKVTVWSMAFNFVILSSIRMSARLSIEGRTGLDQGISSATSNLLPLF